MSHEHDEGTQRAIEHYREHLRKAREIASVARLPEHFYPMRDALDAFDQLIRVMSSKYQEHRDEVLVLAGQVASGIIPAAAFAGGDVKAEDLARISVKAARALLAEVDKS